MVAVHHLDVDSGLGHAAGDLAELARFRLVEPLHQDLSLREDFDPRPLERLAGGGAIREEEVRHPDPVGDEDSTALDARPCPPQGLPHLGQGPRPVLERDAQVLPHRCAPGWTRTVATCRMGTAHEFSQTTRAASSCAAFDMVVSNSGTDRGAPRTKEGRPRSDRYRSHL